MMVANHAIVTEYRLANSAKCMISILFPCSDEFLPYTFFFKIIASYILLKLFLYYKNREVTNCCEISYAIRLPIMWNHDCWNGTNGGI